MLENMALYRVSWFGLDLTFSQLIVQTIGGLLVAIN